MGGSADASGSRCHRRSQLPSHTIVGDPLYCVGEFQLVTLEAHRATLFGDDCVVLVRHNIARVSRTRTPTPATTVCCCRCCCCACDDLLANAQAQHQLQRVHRCAILVAWHCVRHTVGETLHSICRYHQRRTRPVALCVLTRVMSDANDHCALHHKSHIHNIVEYAVQGPSGQTRSGACAFCVVRSHTTDKSPRDTSTRYDKVSKKRDSQPAYRPRVTTTELTIIQCIIPWPEVVHGGLDLQGRPLKRKDWAAKKLMAATHSCFTICSERSQIVPSCSHQTRKK